MQSNPNTVDFEIVTLPIGNGWRIRISGGNHLQFIGGFDDRSKAEEWVRHSSSAWLAKLKTIVECL